ncbi:RNA polymerase II transcription elongation factor-domain-containing protein [Coniella lustricola]|uniref:RNA polymerase II transcription elongation factor-domain-containing protein n=1 Tax=Coniella lustricola TaxID=2025994 RepID=A0A2T3ALT2_9PEZI|nr:RNA polymerase II transcription elongation factor-domain-containing protein [Coniella lustricola]
MAASNTAIPQGVVDPTKPAKYPVILSDALLGKSPKEILTAVRYNHRPTLSSDTAPSSAKLQPVPGSSTDSFDLTYGDEGGRYGFNGTRSAKENQYVLIFDPERKAFVLHRLDSTFNMNITRTPSNNNAASLREEYPHLDGSTKALTEKKGTGKAGGAGGKGGKGKNAAKNAGMVQSKRSGATSTPNATAPSSSSKAKAEPAKIQAESKPDRSRSPADSEDDDSDDGDLLVEWGEDTQPSAVRSMPARTASPLPPVRRFSEFLANQVTSGGESDEDADAEDEDDLIIEEEAGDSSADGFKLPSPVRRQDAVHNHVATEDVDGEEPPEDDELIAMLEQEMDMDSESSVSEED